MRSGMATIVRALTHDTVDELLLACIDSSRGTVDTVQKCHALKRFNENLY